MADYIGWIKIHREIQNHWIYKIDGEYSKYHAWSDLLLNANFKDTKIVIKGTVIELSKGQQARSVLTLVKQWGWSKNKVLRFLDLLKNDGMIDIKTNHLTSVITICNYSSFQNGDTAGDTPNETAGDTPGETAGDTQYKKVKKEKNDKEDKNIDIPPAKAVVIDFDLFWDLYPKKVGIETARKAWKKLKPNQPLFDLIKTHLSYAYIATDKQFIPNGSTYLNQKRWTDEVITTAKPINNLAAMNYGESGDL